MSGEQLTSKELKTPNVNSFEKSKSSPVVIKEANNFNNSLALKEVG